MQFTSSLISAIVAFSAVSLAAPAPELQVRANSKLNQYSNPNWYPPPPLLVPHQFPKTNQTTASTTQAATCQPTTQPQS
ncbi:hypothetical protein V8E51_004988 [Hyaloscypha variabilis]